MTGIDVGRQTAIDFICCFFSLLLLSEISMNAVGTRLRVWGTAAPSVLWLLLTVIAAAGGCAQEKAVEQAPQTFEEARDEHREMMRRERGLTTPAEPGQQ